MVNEFEKLGVRQDLVHSLVELKFSKPTEIQNKAIPLLLSEKTHFIGQAQTGTGKTAAFALPAIQRIDPSKKRIQVLIICPTRELCQQIAKALFKYIKYVEPKVFIESVYGGADLNEQISRLKRPTHILVGTPGRVKELIEKKAVDISGIHQFILDEADEILAMGFKKEVDKILQHTNDFRKIWLFSATIPDTLNELIRQYMPKGTPSVRVTHKSDVINPMIEHQYVLCDKGEKNYMTTEFLNAMGSARGIVFCRTKGDVRTVSEFLKTKGYAVDAMHGEMTQKERDKVMRQFRQKNFKVLVATDMAARGLDVEDLAFVLHYNLPDQAEFYTHRSGRTARAGKRGISLALVTPQDLKKFKFLQEKLVIQFVQVR
jgi:ATP-dependent RNA helicase DeaD